MWRIDVRRVYGFEIGFWPSGVEMWREGRIKSLNR